MWKYIYKDGFPKKSGREYLCYIIYRLDGKDFGQYRILQFVSNLYKFDKSNFQDYKGLDAPGFVYYTDWGWNVEEEVVAYMKLPKKPEQFITTKRLRKIVKDFMSISENENEYVKGWKEFGKAILDAIRIEEERK